MSDVKQCCKNQNMKITDDINLTFTYTNTFEWIQFRS